jgi:hypothetical protein
MAVIRCKLAEDGKSVDSAEIEFQQGDTIEFEPGERPLLAPDLPRELAVQIDSATVCLSLSELTRRPPPPPPNPQTPSVYSLTVVGSDPGGHAVHFPKLPDSPTQLVAILVPNVLEAGLVPNPAYSKASKAGKAAG